MGEAFGQLWDRTDFGVKAQPGEGLGLPLGLLAIAAVGEPHLGAASGGGVGETQAAVATAHDQHPRPRVDSSVSHQYTCITDQVGP